MSLNLFIPAAGYGTRLKPLTNTFPKPLLPVAGVPLIQRIIESVQSHLEIDQIGINTHYLPEVVEDWVSECPFKEKIELYHEEEILGTGGALVNAQKLFNQRTCLLANGDVVSDINWQELIQFHKDNDNLVTLAVQDREHERRVGADSDMNLLCIDKSCSEPGVDHWFGYACAAVYEPEFLNYLPKGESHVVPFWVKASKESGRVKVFNIGRETYWLDIGNPQSYSQAIVDSLCGEKRFMSEALKTPTFTELSGTVVIEKGVEIGERVSLKNAILLPGAKVGDNEQIENSIVVADDAVKIDWPEASKNLKPIEKIGNGGSDRVYSREGDKVKLKYSAFEENIERQINLTEKLIAKAVNVPEIYSLDRNKREVLLQDLGDQTFKSWMIGKSLNEIDDMLGKIILELRKFQFSGIEIKDKVFDYDVLRWETSYFYERFVKRICSLEGDWNSLDKEFKYLAEEVDSLPKFLMHRDFQSENVMIKDGTAWFIDFQGAHLGPPFFDLVSFLADPYTQLPKELVAKYKTSYLSFLGEKLSMSLEECERAYTLCGLQRHMQALGAYGFLAKIKGKESFLNHAPAAFELLFEEVKQVKSEFPVLLALLENMERCF